MRTTLTSAIGRRRIVIGAAMVLLVYVSSYFASWSIAVRGEQGWRPSRWPSSWRIYSPLPNDVQALMVRFWVQFDERLRLMVDPTYCGLPP